MGTHMSCIDRKQHRNFHETFSIIHEPAIVLSSKNRTHFSVGYLHSSIDLIADFYYKKNKNGMTKSQRARVRKPSVNHTFRHDP